MAVCKTVVVNICGGSTIGSNPLSQTMLNPNLNSDVSTIQGNAGVGLAIAYFTGLGHTVSVPLTDTQCYDLVFDNGQLNRVQIKTTRHKKKNKPSYVCGLTTNKRTKHTKFDNTKVDYLFIATPDAMYLIPSLFVQAKTGMHLGKKFESFKVKI
jgi:PD-(D/E)XK endonuclease